MGAHNNNDIEGALRTSESSLAPHQLTQPQAGGTEVLCSTELRPLRDRRPKRGKNISTSRSYGWVLWAYNTEGLTN